MAVHFLDGPADGHIDEHLAADHHDGGQGHYEHIGQLSCGDHVYRWRPARTGRTAPCRASHHDRPGCCPGAACPSGRPHAVPL